MRLALEGSLLALLVKCVVDIQEEAALGWNLLLRWRNIKKLLHLSNGVTLFAEPKVAVGRVMERKVAQRPQCVRDVQKSGDDKSRDPILPIHLAGRGDAMECLDGAEFVGDAPFEDLAPTDEVLIGGKALHCRRHGPKRSKPPAHPCSGCLPAANFPLHPVRGRAHVQVPPRPLARLLAVWALVVQEVLQPRHDPRNLLSQSELKGCQFRVKATPKPPPVHGVEAFPGPAKPPFSAGVAV